MDQGSFGRFAEGFAAPFRGIGYLARRPALWGWVAVPVVVTVGMIGLAAAMAWYGAPWLVARLWPMPAGPGLGAAFGRAMWALTVAVLELLVFASSAVALWAIGTVLARPFYDAMGQRVEREELGIELEEVSARQLAVDVAVAAGHSFVALLAYLPVMAVGLLAELVPGVGSILGTVVGMLATAVFLAYELFDVPVGHRRPPLGRRVAFLRQHFARALGLGSAAMLLLAIPLLNFVSMPVAIVGATLLYCAIEREGGGVEEG